MFSQFSAIRQLDHMDCGPTCLMMVAKHHRKSISLSAAREICSKDQQGVSLFGISKAAEQLGFKTSPKRVSFETFVDNANLPVILHWEGNHFVVAYHISRHKIKIADPAKGKMTLTHEQFKQSWCDGNGNGIALFLTPSDTFHEHGMDEKSEPNGMAVLFDYLLKYKRLLGQLGIGALLGTLLNLIFPFLTQALVDHGVNNKNIDFIYLIVIAQLVLFLSKTATEFIRGWIVAHMGTRINIEVISDFLVKLMKLPMSFFYQRNLGDILQRISDNERVEEFLTSHSIGFFFSALNLIVFSIVLATYSGLIFAIFLIGSILSVVWVIAFLNKRKVLEHKKFAQMGINHNKVVQMVHGMPEIKLNRSELTRRWEWERVQERLFDIRLKALAVEQYQQAGNLFLNEGKNILITFIAAIQVVNGEITLGMMMAIAYILGQMNAPIEQLMTFIRVAQDAKISMERLQEVQQHPDEKQEQHIRSIASGDITVSDLSFKYGLHDKSNVIENLSLNIPHQKTTAIVGASGSGKTTLMKLLLKFYQPQKGTIKIASQDLEYICPQAWREKCGVVMQDGYLFSDTIARNIALGDETIDFERIIHAAKSANFHDEIERFPQAYHTKVGIEGLAMSGGQKQRLLLARAIYKNPEYLFLDEATSALDANNEKVIQANLKYFFKGKTVVVIAHRLSTVKSADNIVVIDNGCVVEQGNHESLTQQRGHFYQLVKNQLELGD